MQKNRKKKKVAAALIVAIKIMNKYIAELIETFALVFFGTGAIIIDQQTNGSIIQVGVAITFGLIIMAMIYALGIFPGTH